MLPFNFNSHQVLIHLLKSLNLDWHVPSCQASSINCWILGMEGTFLQTEKETKAWNLT